MMKKNLRRKLGCSYYEIKAIEQSYEDLQET
jgi:hypothetical protein